MWGGPRPGGAPPGGRAGGGRAGRLRDGRRAPARRRGHARRPTGPSWTSWRAGPGWSASARPGSTTTTTTRRASCSRPPTGASSRWRARPRLAVVSHVRDAHADAAAILREEAGRRRRHPLLLGRRRRGARLPRPRPAPLVLGHPDVQERGQRARGRRVRAARPHPGRDRRALPGADPPPRAQERTRLHRRDAGRAGGACAVCRWPRSTRRPPRTRGGCLACRRVNRSGRSGYSIALRELHCRPSASGSATRPSTLSSTSSRPTSRAAASSSPAARRCRWVRRSRSRSSWRAARSRWRATARSPGSRPSIRPRRRSRTAWASSSCASTRPSRELLNKILARKAAASSPARRRGADGAGPDRAPTGSARTAPRSRKIDTNVDLAPEFGVDEARLRRAVDRNWLGAGKAAGEIDELENLLKPEPIEPVCDRAGAGRAAAPARSRTSPPHERRLPPGRRRQARRPRAGAPGAG